MNFGGNRKIKFELMRDMSRLKQEIMIKLFQYVETKPDQWHKYKGEFKFEGKNYNLECECRCDGEMFTYRHLFIEHKQIVIDVDDLVKKGLLE